MTNSIMIVNDFETALNNIETNLVSLLSGFNKANRFEVLLAEDQDIQEMVQESKLSSIAQINTYQRISKVADVLNDVCLQIRTP